MKIQLLLCPLRWLCAAAVCCIVAAGMHPPSSQAASFSDTNWSAMGSGMGTVTFPPQVVVEAVVVSGSNVYAGGIFTTAGGNYASHVARWNGSSWSALSSGIGGNVYALAMSGSNLYAGGSFTSAGGVAATNIARWDGHIWSPLGAGVNSGVEALAVWGNDVYAGGGFTNAGDVAANGIAKWDGTNWSALGLGVSYGSSAGVVASLLVSGGNVYAGGLFTGADGNPVNNIAKWDGTSWSGLGSGLTYAGQQPTVKALAMAGNNLYAGGWFATAGGSAANRIAKWNGSSWSTLGSAMGGTSAEVLALAISGSNVYAAGTFTTAGGTNANCIAKWDGSTWTPLGSGLSGGYPYPYGRALAVSATDLYAGGLFTAAGGKSAAYVAKAMIVEPANAVSAPVLSGGNFAVRFAGTPGATYTIEYTANIASPSWQKATNLTAPSTDLGLGVGVFEFQDNPAGASNRFYRTVYPSY